MQQHDINISPFKHLYPFESHFLTVNGLKYHYLDEGHGDPVVMLHGNPTWSFYYRNLVQALSTRFRTIVPDHIGCGLSDKPTTRNYPFRLQNRIDDLSMLLQHLAITDKITLVLHDWGGMIGIAYALGNVQRISRLIVMNTAAFFPPAGKKIPLRLWLVRHIKPFAILAVLGFNIFAWGASYMASAKRLPREVRQGLTAPYNSWNNRRATLKFVQDIPIHPGDPSFDLVKKTESSLHKLAQIPMLVCWGKRDFVFDPDYYLEWQRRFPKAESHLFTQAGHYILEDEPEDVIARIKDFLKRHPV